MSSFYLALTLLYYYLTYQLPFWIAQHDLVKRIWNTKVTMEKEYGKGPVHKKWGRINPRGQILETL